MAKQLWKWNNFRGGLSDNPFLVSEGQYAEGINIDVQTEPSGFKLCSTFSSLVTTASATNAILDLAEFGGTGIYSFCAAGEIYKDASGTAIYTDTTGSEIKQATAMWSGGTLYIYYITAVGTIHRINVDGTGHATKGSITGSAEYPLIKYQGDIYFGDKNVLRKLDTSETLTAHLTFPVDEVITGLTVFQDSFKVYVTCGTISSPRNGKQYIVNPTSPLADYMTFWNKLPILGATNIGATDYVVTGAGPNYSDLYAVSGTQRQLIKSNFEGMTYGRKFNSKIVSWKDELFMLGDNQEIGTLYGNAIFRLGQYFPGLPNALTEIYRGSSGWRLYSIMAGYNYLYIGRKGAGATYSTAYIQLDTPSTNYQGSGYIVSPIFDGGDKTIKKCIDMINISYMCDSTNLFFPHGGNIQLFMRISPGASWTQIGSTYTKTDIGNIKISSNEVQAAGLNSFYQAEFKCTITQGSATTSPLITGIEILYDTLVD